MNDTLMQSRLRDISNRSLMPERHYEYLVHLKNNLNLYPKVIYDIGASVLHWTNMSKIVWAESKYIAFEAMQESEFLFQEAKIDYFIGALSDQKKTVDFYKNVENPAGNSYFKENELYSPNAIHLFNESHRTPMLTYTLDEIIEKKQFPYADFIKMDVQGAELDILKGASNALQHCNNLILELQIVEYNKGAPLRDTVIDYLNTIGFTLVCGPFSDNGPDGDYHFTRT